MKKLTYFENNILSFNEIKTNIKPLIETQKNQLNTELNQKPYM